MLLQPEIANYLAAKYYGAYRVRLRITDLQGQTLEVELVFYTIDRSDPSFILEIYSYREARLVVKYETPAQRQPLTINSLRINKPNQFAKALLEEPRVYIIVLAPEDGLEGTKELPKRL